jgi:C-terminal processing protease CtpA/Prc
MRNEGEKLGDLKLTIAKFYRYRSSTQHKGVCPD